MKKNIYAIFILTILIAAGCDNNIEEKPQKPLQKINYDAELRLRIDKTDNKYWATIFIKNISDKPITLIDIQRPQWNMEMWFNWEVNDKPISITENIACCFEAEKRIIPANEEIQWDRFELSRVLNYSDSTTKPLSTIRSYLKKPGEYKITVSPSSRWKEHNFKPITETLKVE